MQAQIQALTAVYQAEQSALWQEQQALTDGGATPEQVEAWRQQAVPRFAAQGRRAQRLALLQAWDQLPAPGAATIPADASPALASFLQTRAGLFQAHVRLHNQRAQALPADATVQEILQSQQDEADLFAQQQAAALAVQARQAQVLAQESADRVIPLPPPLQVPVDASPPLAAYLAARDALMRAQIQLQNQYAGADPDMRQAALAQWQQQNAAALAQLQALAIALGQNR